MLPIVDELIDGVAGRFAGLTLDLGAKVDLHQGKGGQGRVVALAPVTLSRYVTPMFRALAILQAAGIGALALRFAPRNPSAGRSSLETPCGYLWHSSGSGGITLSLQCWRFKSNPKRP